MNNIRHANSFDFLRLAGSLMVLYSHGFAVSGLPEPVLGALCSYGSMGVLLFFSISGYLVSTSWLSDSNLARFTQRRALRIFPGLAACILLSTFVLGPIVTTLPLRTYFTHPATYRYLETIALYVNYMLPGCFATVPLASTVNGSLWSLPPEVLMYVVLAVLGVLSLIHRRLFVAAFTVFVCLTDLYLLRSVDVIIPLIRWHIPPHPAPVLFWGMELHQVMQVAPYFWVGCLFRLYRDRIKYSMNGAIASFMLMAIIPPGELLWAFSFFAIPYIALSFCLQYDPLFQISPRIGDLSYGIYIYAFPVQQLVYYYLHPRLSFWPIQAISAIVTIAFSYLSWHMIENTSLRLKPARRKAVASTA